MFSHHFSGKNILELASAVQFPESCENNGSILQKLFFCVCAIQIQNQRTKILLYDRKLIVQLLTKTTFLPCAGVRSCAVSFPSGITNSPECLHL